MTEILIFGQSQVGTCTRIHTIYTETEITKYNSNSINRVSLSQNKKYALEMRSLGCLGDLTKKYIWP